MKRRTITVLCLLPLVGSCISTTKVPIKASEVIQFKEGATTRSDVIEYYGKPHSEGISGTLSNICYLNHGSDTQLLFMQFESNQVLASKHLNDARAKSECSSLIPAASSGGSSISGSSGSNCTIYDGLDNFGRPKYRCAHEPSSASRNQPANKGQNCTIPDGVDNFGRPKYRCH